jgi:ADP-L-glycero-D-manno-heptose 6-epimerase
MIAVTGAAGFIGSNLAHRLASMGHDLLLVDDELTAEKLANWAGLQQFQFVNHDLFADRLERGELSPDAIFHLGACSSTTETDWNYLKRNNIEYSQRLWTWSARTARPFIYASSAATYGDGSRGFDDRLRPDELQPLNLYGRSKNDFDRWVLDQCAGGKASIPPTWAGLKFFNVYGPRERHKGRMASVVWQSYRQILETGRMRLFRSNDPQIADGEQKRDFVFVNDCVDHMLWLWKHGGPGNIYNSGTGAARTFLDLTKAVFSALGKAPNIEFIDMPKDVVSQYQNLTRADMSKLHAAGYSQPATPIEEGVAQYVRWIVGQ